MKSFSSCDGMKPEVCADCPYALDKLLIKYRRITFTRISDTKVSMELVSDQEPTAKQPIVDKDAVSCLCRISR